MKDFEKWWESEPFGFDHPDTKEGILKLLKVRDERIKELEKKLKVAVEALEFYAKTESWEADGWIANADLYEPWGHQGISLGGKRARLALAAINGG
jgi:hypothetical protein